MVKDYDNHLRANLSPVVGQFSCPEEVEPKKRFKDHHIIIITS